MFIWIRMYSSKWLYTLAAILVSSQQLTQVAHSMFVYHSFNQFEPKNASQAVIKFHDSVIHNDLDRSPKGTDHHNDRRDCNNILNDCNIRPNHASKSKRSKRAAQNVSRYRLARAGKWGPLNNTASSNYVAIPENRRQLDPFEGTVFASNYHKNFLLRPKPIGGTSKFIPGVGSDFQAKMRHFTKPTTVWFGVSTRITSDLSPRGEHSDGPGKASSRHASSDHDEVPVKTTPQVFVPDDISHNPYPHVITPDSGRGIEIYPHQPPIPPHDSSSDFPPGLKVPHTSHTTPARGDGIGDVRSGDDSAASYNIWKPDRIPSSPQPTNGDRDLSSPYTTKLQSSTYPYNTDTQSLETPVGAQDGLVHEGPGYGSVDKVWVSHGIERSTLPKYNFTPPSHTTSEQNVPGIRHSSISSINGTLELNNVGGTRHTGQTSPVSRDYLFESTLRHTTQKSSTLNPIPDNLTPNAYEFPDTLNGEPHSAIPRVSLDTPQATNSLDGPTTAQSLPQDTTPKNGKSYALIDDVGQDRGIYIIRYNQSFPEPSPVPSHTSEQPYFNGSTSTRTITSEYPSVITTSQGAVQTHPTREGQVGIGGVGEGGFGIYIDTSPSTRIPEHGSTTSPHTEEGLSTQTRPKVFVPPLTTKPWRREPLIDFFTTPSTPIVGGNVGRVDSDRGFEIIQPPPIQQPGIVRPDRGGGGGGSSFSISPIIIPDDGGEFTGAMFGPRFSDKFTPGLGGTPPSRGLPRISPQTLPPLKRQSFEPRLQLLDQFRPGIKGRPRPLVPPQISNGVDQVPPSVYGMDMDAWQCEFDTMALNNKRQVDFKCPEDQSDNLYPVADKQCLWYVMCSNDYPWYMCCPAGTLFDSVNRKCEHVNRVSCISGVGYPRDE